MQIGINLALTQRNGGAGAPALNIDFAGTGVLPSTVTFSRGTNATLTNSNGRIAWAPHNLLTNSEDFEAAAWGKTSINTTGTPPWVNVVVAPDGTSTADKLIANTNNTDHVVSQATISITSGSAYTFSAFFKGDASNQWVQLGGSSGAFGVNVWANFDVLNGVVGFVGSSATATIEPASNGFFRCIVTGTATASTTGGLNIFLLNNTNTNARSPAFVGSNTDGVSAWGAQLNVGSTAQSYNSTTPKNLLGFTQEPENAAWTKSNSYVQQNLLTWSQDFDNAAWTKTQGVVLADQSVAPDGTNSADKLRDDSTPSATHFVSQAQTTAAASYTFSVYAKKAERSHVMLYHVQSNVGAIFNLDTGVVTTPTGIPLATGFATDQNNGWWKCQITVTATAASNTFRIYLASNSTTFTYNGDGTSGLFIWGAQLVQGSTAGDYTQTTSAAAPTRYLNWDGTLTGRKLVEDTAGGVHVVYASTAVAAVPYTLSMYAKPAERNFARLDFVTSAYAAGSTVILNLTTGVTTVTNYGATTGTTATAVSVGGGWYRLTMTVQATAATYFSQIGLSSTNSTGSYTGDGTSGIYVSDFQLSNSASVDPYVYNPQAAAASAAYYGPRFDYNPTGTPVLSGVELVTNGTFDGGTTTGWTGGNATLAVVSGAMQVTGGTGGNGYAYQAITTVAGARYQLSFTTTFGTETNGLCWVGTSIGANDLATLTWTVAGSKTLSFVATGTTSYIRLGQNTPTTGLTLSFDNISVQAITGYTATANGLLIEEQRTNLLTYSNDWSNAAWVRTNVTITGTATLSPDGTVNASKIESTATGSGVYNSAVVAATSATASVYLKQGTGATIANGIGLRNNTTATNLIVGTLDYSTGVFTYTTGSTGVVVTNVGNGWWRVSLTATAGITSGDTLRFYTGLIGAASTSGDFCYGYGAQLEAGSFATSYIPTVASQVTRNADSASMLGDNFYTWYNPNQGTLSGEASRSALGGNSPIATVFSATNTRMQVGNNTGGGGTAEAAFYVQNAGADQAWLRFASAVTANVPFKIVGAYNLNNFGASANGAATLTDTSGTVPVATSLLIGASGTAGNAFNGTIRRIGYYNTRLPDSTLQALTT